MSLILFSADVRELIDMLPDEMVEEAAEAIFTVPEDPEEYDDEEVARLGRAKEEFRRDTWIGAEGVFCAWGEVEFRRDTGVGGMPNNRVVDGAVRDGESEYPNPESYIRAKLRRLVDSLSGESLLDYIEILSSCDLLDIPIQLSEETWASIEESDREDSTPWEQFKEELGADT